MIFRQLFDPVSCTYTYLLGSREGGEALLVDPVLDRVDRYLQLIEELDLKLVKAVDTHVHADHITGLGELRDRTHCVTVMGAESGVDVVSMRIAEGDKVSIEGGISLDAIYTPGHTDDSYSFLLGDRLFSGDTLLIRARAHRLPERQSRDPVRVALRQTTATTRRNARVSGPRLQGRHGVDHRRGAGVTILACRFQSINEYVDIMNSLGLADPKMMDVAVPANLHIGLAQGEVARKGWALDGEQLQRLLERENPLLIDLREDTERQREGVLPGALHLCYDDLSEGPRAGRAARRARAFDGAPARLLLCLRRALGDGRGSGARGGHAGGGAPEWGHQGLEGGGLRGGVARRGCERLGGRAVRRAAPAGRLFGRAQDLCMTARRFR